MSWWVKEIESITDDNLYRLCYIEADDTTLFPAPVQQKEVSDPDNPGQTIWVTDYTIVRGSKLYCLSNASWYKLNSSGQWILQTTGGGGSSSADQISYDNTESGMTATNVQQAIDETHELDDMQDRALAELYAADVNIGLRIDGLEDDIDAKTTVAEIYGLPPTTIAPEENTTVSLNSYTSPGAYTVPTATAAGRVTESPVTTRGYRLEVKQYRSGAYYRQTIMAWGEANAFYTRSRQGGTTWTAWYRFEGTQVQTVQSQSLNSPLNLSRNDLNESLDSNFDLADSIQGEEEGELDDI